LVIGKHFLNFARRQAVERFGGRRKEAAMALRVARLFNLLFVMADFGLMFAHVLEIPGKLRFAAAQWLAVQQNLYVGFGTVGAVAEVLALATTWWLVYLTRGRTPAFRLTLFAAVMMAIAFATWFFLIDPINAVIAASTPDSLPPDWTALRNRWEMWHAIRAGMALAALSALIWAILAEAETERRAGH
jgi:hypothetical protein